MQIKRVLYSLITIFYVLHVLGLLSSLAAVEVFGWGGILLVILAEIQERIVNKKTLFVSHPFNKYVLMLGLAVVISIVFSPVITIAKEPWHFYIGRFRYLLLFFFHTTVLTYFVDIKKLLKWLPVFILPITLLYLFESASGTKLFYGRWETNWDWTFSRGVIGYFRQYIEFSTIFEMFLMLMIPFAFFSGYSKKYKIFLFATILTVLFSTAVSGTRAFFIAVPFAILIQILLSKNKKYFVVVVISIMAISVLAYKTNDFIQEKAAHTFSNIEKFGDPYRYNLWRAHLLIFKDHPVTGLGYYVATDAKFLEPYYKKLKTVKKETYRGLTHAHNNYIDILSGTGLIGFICFMLFLIMLIKHTLRSRKIATQKNLEYEQLLSIGLMGAIVSIMTNMLMDTSLQMIKVCYPFIFIVGLCIYQNNKLTKIKD